MFQSLKDKLAALRDRLTSTPEKQEERPEAPTPPPKEPSRPVVKKKKAAAKAMAAPAAPQAPKRPIEDRSNEDAQEVLGDEADAPSGTEPAASMDDEKADDESPFSSGIFGWKLRESRLDPLLWDLEVALLESDVALPAIDAIKKRVKKDLLDRRVKIGMEVAGVVEDALKDAMTSVLTDPVNLSPKLRKSPSRFEPPFFNEFIDKKPKPVVLMFVGINGTGKTTSIAKVCFMLQKQGYTCVIGAGDTFRAGAIEQLEKHADKLGVKLIKHQAGSDPASVAFDTIEHARARKKDIVLIDTAGRMQTDIGLMEEMSKIERVAKPDLVIYVGDALAGNDAVNEAMAFNKAVGIDAVILTKVDADAKGGAALSIRYSTGAPVIFVGTGQEYNDIEPFGAKWMVDRIFGDSVKTAD
jgi:fused signal recognition particle receptor